jgi:transcriptional regulator with XRE-family HTH domain
MTELEIPSTAPLGESRVAPSPSHREQLGAFLRRCRARLAPAEVGLPGGRRRRTPGLRREDVAMLAGLSLTWYTWLEQGRGNRVSAEILERICVTLRLSADERAYLFGLVQHRPAPPLLTADEAVSPTLQRMIDALAIPALVKTARWDVIAWNQVLGRVLRDYEKLPPGRRNLLRILLVEDDEYQRDPVVYERMARRVLAKFRVDYSLATGDPAFEELIAELDAICPIFKRLWNSPEIAGRSEAVTSHRHLGGMQFEHSSYVPEGHATLRVLLFVPYDEATAAKVAAARRELSMASASAR